MAKRKQYIRRKAPTSKGCGIALLIFLGIGAISAILHFTVDILNYLVQNPLIPVSLVVIIVLIVFLYVKFIKPQYLNFRMNRVQGKLDGIKTALDAAPTLDSLQESARLINTTVEPSEFFYQFDYLVKQLEWIINSKIDRKYLTASPEKDLKRLLGGKDKSMELFIDRCLKSVLLDLANCKTQEEACKVKNRYCLISNYSDVLSEKNYERFKSNLDGLDSFAMHIIAKLPYKIVPSDNCDEMLIQAIEYVVDAGMATTSILQRRLKLGYARAAQLIDNMEEMGIVGQFKGSAPRDVLITREQIKDIDFSKVSFTVPSASGISDENPSNHYDNMDGHEFERFCADLLKKNGFVNVEVTVGSGDYGVDVLAAKDGVTYAIQCKCYSSNIGNKAVQEIYSGKDFYKRHVGVVMTNQYFTPSAKETAERTGIVLWDRDWLERMIK